MEARLLLQLSALWARWPSNRQLRTASLTRRCTIADEALATHGIQDGAAADSIRQIDCLHLRALDVRPTLSLTSQADLSRLLDNGDPRVSVTHGK